MPRKAKEKIDENEIIDENKTVAGTDAVKTAKKKSSTTKKTSVEKDSNKKTSTTKKSTTAAKKSTTTSKKSSTTSKKSSTTSKKSSDVEKASTAKRTKKSSVDEDKEPEKKVTRKSSKKAPVDESEEPKKKATRKSTKKASVGEGEEPEKKVTRKRTKKAPVDENEGTKKKSTRKRVKKSSESVEPPIQIAEYYDLPYRYGNTVVRLLAQTPKTLFIYWEVSDLDIENFKKNYGEDFFNLTKPVIIVHNLTLNKSYEVEINDFANCWYLSTEDSDCKFDIELGRRFIKNSSTQEINHQNSSDYIYITTSNNLQSPNDHILFEKLKEFVIFKDVSNNKVIKRKIKSFKFLNDIYKFYEDMYDDEILNNPSSQFKF